MISPLDLQTRSTMVSLSRFIYPPEFIITSCPLCCPSAASHSRSFISINTYWGCQFVYVSAEACRIYLPDCFGFRYLHSCNTKIGSNWCGKKYSLIILQGKCVKIKISTLFLNKIKIKERTLKRSTHQFFKEQDYLDKMKLKTGWSQNKLNR